MKKCQVFTPENKFSYIIGNPPYITYSEIKKTEIKKLKMFYLIPSSIFKTVFGNNLRSFILPHTKEIIDYSLHKVFSDALVKSSILRYSEYRHKV